MEHTWLQRGDRPPSRFEKAVQQGETHQASDDVVETDQIGGAVSSFRTKEDFCRVFVVMNADIERALSGDLDLLCDVISAGGERARRVLMRPPPCLGTGFRRDEGRLGKSPQIRLGTPTPFPSANPLIRTNRHLPAISIIW